MLEKLEQISNDVSTTDDYLTYVIEFDLQEIVLQTQVLKEQ
jgi:hypothetical protein